MIPRFPAQRRAEAFHAAVEGDASREHGDADLLELVGALRSAAPVTARPEFVGDLRARLMAEAATALAPGAVAQTRPETDDRLRVAPRRSARDRRLAAGLAGLALVGATGSVAVAAQSALPGDVLYPVKRAIENAQTGFSVGDADKGATLLANASGRLDEAGALAGEGESDRADEIAATLDSFTQQATEASELLVQDYEENGNADSIAELRDFTHSSMAELTALEGLVPPAARGALVTAAQVLTQIDAAAQNLCPVCGGEGISVIPPQFVTASITTLLGELAVGGDAVDVRAEQPGALEGERRTGQGDRARGRDGDGPRLPHVGADAPPGSVTSPDGEGASPGVDGGDPQGPLGQIGDHLQHGGSQPTSEPSVPVVTPALEGVGELLEELTGGLLGGDSTQP